MAIVIVHFLDIFYGNGAIIKNTKSVIFNFYLDTTARPREEHSNILATVRSAVTTNDFGAAKPHPFIRVTKSRLSFTFDVPMVGC